MATQPERLNPKQRIFVFVVMLAVIVGYNVFAVLRGVVSTYDDEGYRDAIMIGAVYLLVFHTDKLLTIAGTFIPGLRTPEQKPKA
jgi:hypothetical protein